MTNGDFEFGNADFLWVLELSLEPSYISEIARKLMELEVPLGLNVAGVENSLLLDEDNNVVDDDSLIGRTWADLEENTAVRMVGSIVNLAMDNEDLDLRVEESSYDVIEGDSSMGQSQKEGSIHQAFGGNSIVETNEWRDYKVVHNENRDPKSAGEQFDNYGLEELGSKVNDIVDPNVTVEDKLRVVEAISRLGNDVSRFAERIMQDVMERQFRHYDKVEYGDYNDSGVDFYVEDMDRRDYGLAIEVSVRWVNPIGTPYVEEKENKAIKYDGDLVILAPRFTDSVMKQYENLEDGMWHEYPEESIVHLHRVPGETERVYRPFAVSTDDVTDRGNDIGNPIIVSDSEKLSSWLVENGHVGNDYPIVDKEFDDMMDMLGSVNRKFTVITESEYRYMLREAIEPLLWEFLRPYKVEQFLIDTYWDKSLTQGDIGSLVDSSESTIGRWMRKWDIITRAGGAPELSDETLEVWKVMYNGEEPFPKEFSIYRILAEYNRHPLWNLDDWQEWYDSTSSEEVDKEIQEVMSKLGDYREDISYTVMLGPTDILMPSYGFVRNRLDESGVEIRDPDEAPRVPYNAYPSRDALEYMINKGKDVIIEVE